MAEQSISAGALASSPQATTTAAPPLRRRNRIEKWLFLLPAVAFQLVWGWFPLVFAFALSLTDARVRGPVSFIGLQSYTRMWNDPLLHEAFRVTFAYAALSIVLTFIIPIIVAIFLMEMPPRVMRWMMLLWFLPLSSIASTVLWKYAYNPDYGILQHIFQSLGLPEQRFLNDPNSVLFWLIFPGILLFGPGLIYMAALQGIPSSYYEAAEVEGASFWRKIWTISLPRLRPVISMLLTFAIIASLQEFNQPQILTGGGPGSASRTVVVYLYGLWGQLRFGDATTVAVFLFVVIMVVTLLYRTFFKEDPDA
jgi:multiple sugar transport system permease protein